PRRPGRPGSDLAAGPDGRPADDHARHDPDGPDRGPDPVVVHEAGAVEEPHALADPDRPDDDEDPRDDPADAHRHLLDGILVRWMDRRPKRQPEHGAPAA